MGNWFFILAGCDVFVLKSLFVRLVRQIYKTMCLPRTSSLGFFCTLLIIITVRWKFVRTGLVQQPSFRYRFRAICSEFAEFKKCQWFVLRHNSSYKLYYIFERNGDKKCVTQIYWIVIILILVKYLVAFNHLEVRSILHYIMYKSFVNTAQKGHRRVHLSNFPF